MPWQGRQDTMVDRFDMRTTMDHLGEYEAKPHNKPSLTAEGRYVCACVRVGGVMDIGGLGGLAPLSKPRGLPASGLPYVHVQPTPPHGHTYKPKPKCRPPTDPELPAAQACLVNFERYRPLVEALRLGMGPAKHLQRCVRACWWLGVGVGVWLGVIM